MKTVVQERDTVRVSSDGIFTTIQGEGPLIGTPSIFVRLDTCNLRCKWGETLCDAHYTSWTPGDSRVSRYDLCDSLVKRMFTQKCRHVVITGGEPMLQREAVQALCRAIYYNGGHTTIETNGTIYFPTVADLICLSPKLESSTPVGTKYEYLHRQNRWNPPEIRRFMQAGNYYFKFVMDSEGDLREILTMLGEVGQHLPDPEHVFLMPQGIIQEELWERGRWVAEICKQIGARFSPRIQIDLWGNERGR